jgi:hypothetical protein
MGVFRVRFGDVLLALSFVVSLCVWPSVGMAQASPAHRAQPASSAPLVPPAPTPAPVPMAETDSDARARALFEEGRTAFDSGAYAVALERWRASYELSGKAELLYNIGLVHDRLRQNAEAIAAFEAFLSAFPDTPRAPEIQARVRAIRVAMSVETQPRVQPTTASTQWYEHWWVWGLAGAVVVGGAAVGVAVGMQDDEAKRADPIKPRTGITVQTLRFQ